MAIIRDAGVKRVLMALLILTVGAGIGGGAARIAESTVATDIAQDARTLDRMASLAESASLMQAAVNQAMLLAGTDRPGALARAEAKASVEVFTTHLAQVVDDDVLIDAGEDMVGRVGRTLEELNTPDPIGEIGAATPTLEVSYEVFSDILSERRRTTRTRIAVSSDSTSSVAVALAALVVFLAPAAIVFVIVQWIRRQTETLSAETPSEDAFPEAPKEPSSIFHATELEIRQIEPSSTASGSEPEGGSGPDPLLGPLSTPDTLNERAAPSGAESTVSLVQRARARSAVARNLATLDRIRTGTLSLVIGRVDLAPIAGRVAGQVSGYDGLVDVLARQVEVEADPLRVDDILNLLLSASLAAGASKLALVVDADHECGTVAVAGAGTRFNERAIEALERPDESEHPIAIELAVAGELARALKGAVVHERHEDMTLLTLRLPLADG